MTENLHTLDTRNRDCPLPILRTRKAIDDMQVGGILEIATTDPGAVKDLNLLGAASFLPRAAQANVNLFI